jgi:glycerophosphoryl diester phosphodiesterase
MATSLSEEAGHAQRRPLLLGHRGASHYAPENTVDAFELALQHGCDGFEFDVRYTKDLRGVVCHDRRRHRRSVHSHTLEELRARERRALDLPCADEVIREYARRAYLDVELKLEGEVGPILEALAATPEARFVVSSFLPELLLRLHARAPQVPLGLIAENARQLARAPDLPVRMVMIHRRLAARLLIDKLHEGAKQVMVWTVNRESEMRELAALGIDGIISDDTLLLARTLGEKEPLNRTRGEWPGRSDTH